MAILGLVTSGPGAQVGLQPASGDLLRAAVDRQARGRDLIATVHGLLRDAGLQPGDLAGIVVDRGPGSFTGVRVGVTCAKTLAFALAVPTVGITSLEALAWSADIEGPVVAVRDAGRDTLYVGAFGPRSEGRPARSPPTRCRANEVDLPEGVWVGEDAPTLAAKCGVDTAQDVAVSLEAVLELGMPRLADAPPAHALAPCYLQASAPERLRRGDT